MKILKFAALGLCGIIVLVLVRGMFMRSTWDVERSITIEAPPAAIQPLLADLHFWPEWMAWSKERDPTSEYSFSGEGVGAVMHWTGKKLGQSNLTLTAIAAPAGAPPQGIGYDLWLAGRDDASHGTVRLEPVGVSSQPARGTSPRAATKVVWHDTGDVGWNPMYRLILPVVEPALGRDFTVGLERLKRKVESVH